MVVWVSLYPSAPETLYLIDFHVLSQSIVSRPAVLLNVSCGIRYAVLAIIPGGKIRRMQHFVGLGCLLPQIYVYLIPVYSHTRIRGLYPDGPDTTSVSCDKGGAVKNEPRYLPA